MDTVLITGTSTGIGFETALSFARKGYQVIATMRNLDKKTKLAEIANKENLAIELVALDVTNDLSVQTAVDGIMKKYGNIAILINNAGAGFRAALEQTSMAQLQAVMDANFYGAWRLVKAVFPHMRKQRRGQIISVTSVGGISGQPFNDAYCAAKFAVEGMMECLAPVAKQFGISISLVEPGPVLSEFITSAREVSPSLSSELDNDYKPMLDAFTKATTHVFQHYGQKPDTVANVLLQIAKTAQPNLRYQTCEFSELVAKTKMVDPTGNQSRDFASERLKMEELIQD